MEKKLKHLEFIQNIITRMNSNSFMIKGWAVTLIAAILIFADKTNSKDYLIVPLVAIILFFLLDAYYLCMEKQYRALYNKIVTMTEDEIDFTIDASPFKISIYDAIKSPSIWLLYVLLIGLISLMWGSI
ncbi:MAG: hypothetical protein WAT92_24685 [Saprospiraceae bacterium]